MAASLDGAERRPRKSAAAIFACSFSGAAGVDIAAEGATAATAEARAVRRANSRRGIRFVLGPLGFEGSSLRVSLRPPRRSWVCPAGGALKGRGSGNRAERGGGEKREGSLWMRQM